MAGLLTFEVDGGADFQALQVVGGLASSDGLWLRGAFFPEFFHEQYPGFADVRENFE